MLIQAAPLEPSIPTLQFTFDEAAFKSVLMQWQSDGIARFKAHFLIDFPFLFSYGLFGYQLSRQTSLLKNLPVGARSLLSWILPAAAAMDAAENLLHLDFVFAVTAIPPPLYLVAGVAATAKWSLIVAFLAAIGYGAVRKAGSL